MALNESGLYFHYKYFTKCSHGEDALLQNYYYKYSLVEYLDVVVENSAI